jgi:hypothetical protein
MAVPALLDTFIQTAGQHLDRLDAAVIAAHATAPDPQLLGRDLRALRAATIAAGQTAIGGVVLGLEGVAEALERGRVAWDPTVRGALLATLGDCRLLVRRARTWSPDDEARALRRRGELARLAPLHQPVDAAALVPIAALAPDDGAPQLVVALPAGDPLLPIGALAPDTTPAPLPVMPPAPAAPVTPPPAPPAPAPPAASAAPAAQGAALQDLLGRGLAGLTALDDVPLSPPLEVEEELVDIDALLYRGRAAFDRACALGDAMRGAPPDPDALEELLALLDLARHD